MAYRRYWFTEKAEKDLNDIFDHIINNLNNKQAAKKLYGKIIKVLEVVLIFPKCFPIFNNSYIKNINIRKFQVSGYSVFYTLKKNDVIILRIIHSKRDIANITENIIY